MLEDSEGQARVDDAVSQNVLEEIRSLHVGCHAVLLAVGVCPAENTFGVTKNTLGVIKITLGVFENTFGVIMARGNRRNRLSDL